MNQDCDHYVEEKDTGFCYCSRDQESCENCEYYYPKTDAKADARYGSSDRY